MSLAPFPIPTIDQFYLKTLQEVYENSPQKSRLNYFHLVGKMMGSRNLSFLQTLG